MRDGWVKSQSEPDTWTLKTEWGTAVVKPTRTYPRGRTFRVIVNGKDVSRFDTLREGISDTSRARSDQGSDKRIARIIAAMIAAEDELGKIARDKSGFF